MKNKKQHYRFDITFQRDSGNYAENGTWSSAEITSTYPFSDLKEYSIEFEVLAEHWKVTLHMLT
jgi:hypothetical protein